MKTFYVVGVLDAKQSVGIGWWRDGETVYQDPIAVYEDIQEALKAGKENRQECILEVKAHPNGEAFLNYANDLFGDIRIGDAFAEGKTTGVTRLYEPLNVDGVKVTAFTVTDTPLQGVESVPCSFRFIYTNEVEGRFTYYLNLLIAKTQKAGRLFLYDGAKPFTVRIGRWAFNPDGAGDGIPAIRYEYGNEEDGAFNRAFTANGRNWCCVKGLPSENIPDELGQTFKRVGRKESHLLLKVQTYWEKLGGSAYLGEEPSPYAVVTVKVTEGWLNLLPD